MNAVIWVTILIPVKRKSKSGTTYYSPIDDKRVKRKVVQKYVGYLGKSPNSKNEIEREEIMQYVQRLLSKNIS
ncbi:MAG: hypothetical protein QW292_08750 [Candidatus Parvarchaeota archaeon]